MTNAKILTALLLLSAVLLLSHRTRAISGQVLVRDPATGAEGVVAGQGNYYWRIRGTDQVFATDSPAPPLVNQAIDRMDVVN